MKDKFFLICIFLLCFFLLSCMNKKDNISYSDNALQVADEKNLHEDKVPLDELIKSNELNFALVYGDGGYAGSLKNDHGSWLAYYGASYHRMDYVSHNIENDILYVKCLYAIFNLYGNPSYRGYRYPSGEIIQIKREQIEQCLETNRSVDINVSNASECNVFCTGLVITDNLRVREIPIIEDDHIITHLNKFDEIQLIGFTTEEVQTHIDGLEAPWYKCKLSDETEGWVFGGFVKIFFDEHEKELLKKLLKEKILNILISI